MAMQISSLSKGGMALLFGMMCSATYAGDMMKDHSMDKMKGDHSMSMESKKSQMMKKEGEMKTMEGDMKAMEGELPEKMQEELMNKEDGMKMKDGM